MSSSEVTRTPVRYPLSILILPRVPSLTLAPRKVTSENVNPDVLIVPAPPAEPYVRVVPLGGCGEIGRNMTVVETNDDLVVVDCGLMFPDDEMFGVDVVISD